jgi:DNA-binding NtrC family response regulator
MLDAPKPLILVVDDRQDIFQFCRRFLGDEYAFQHVACGRLALAALRAGHVAAVLLDRDFSQADPTELIGPREDVRNEGLHILRCLRHEFPSLPVIMVTGQRDLPTALAASDLGAQFLAWEDVAAQPAMLTQRIAQVLDTSEANSEQSIVPFRRQGIIAESPAFGRTLCSLYRALPGRAPILLLGPTGTGKDTLAYAAHTLAGDPARPFVAVNVAALNPNLVESELFGHARGAFTSAMQAHLGKLRAAHGGTLFLNEIGDLPLEIQAKLLTVIERVEVVPVGDVHSYPAEFRLIAATSRNLRELVESGRFRRDLLHRIAWHTIEIPALKDRPEDIPALANAFLRGAPAGRSGDVLGFAREAMEYLVSLPWDGNVRELRGIVEAACAHARHTVTVADLREVVRRLEAFALAPVVPAAAAPAAPVAGTTASSTMTQERLTSEDTAFAGRTFEEVTRAYYFHLMRVTGRNMSEAADLADIAKTTIYEWRKRHGGNGGNERKEMEGRA